MNQPTIPALPPKPWRDAVARARGMLEANAGLHYQTALRRAATEQSIEWGEEMNRFMAWAETQPL